MIPFLLFYLFAAFVVADSNILDKTNGSVVDLGYVKYNGIKNDVTGVTTYYGIRYAVPPLQDLRWRAPVAIADSNIYNPSDVLDATSQGPECVQGLPGWLGGGNKSIGGQEDCLTVDVLVPNVPASKSLPVWIEIHGGGYTLGNAASMPGIAMVNQSQGGIIFVQVQYRLGAFGFLDSETVRNDGTANAGLLDARLAMDWVQQHISAFGGDAQRVTISGGSAGGGVVTHQLTMYGGVDNPPFRAAVPEYPWQQPHHSTDVTDNQYVDLLMNTGCCDLACLRAVPSDELANAAQLTFRQGYDQGFYGYGDFYYGPTVDGHIVPGLPSQSFASGAFSKVPIMTNRDTHEGLLFTNLSLTTEQESIRDLQLLWPNADSSFFAALDQLYPASAYTNAVDRVAAIFGDAFVVCGTRQLAEAFYQRGVPVWKQIFNAGDGLHAATVPFLFEESSDGVVTAVNTSIGQAMKDWFLSFALHLDPNTESFTDVKKPYWAEYGRNSSVVVVNATTYGTSVDPDDSARCAFFATYGNEILV